MAHVITEALVYRPTSSPIHRLDPRCRLLIALMLFAFSLAFLDLPKVVLVLALVILAGTLSKILRRLAKLQILTGILVAFILVINIIIGYSVIYSLTLSLRFLSIVSSTSVFFLTTSPDELEQVLKWLRAPRDVVFAFTTAVRFVPVLMLDLSQIIAAQRSRGLEFEKGNPITRLRKLSPILVPMIVTALLRSNDLAEAIEVRGYGVSKRPTSIYELKFSKYDWSCIVIVVLATAALTFLLIY